MLDLFTLSVLIRVSAGIGALDRATDSIFADWRQKIDLLDLDMASSCRCVLGQISTAEGGRDWWPAVDAFGPGFNPEMYGFDVRGYRNPWGDETMSDRRRAERAQEREYAALQLAWEQVLLAA